MIKIAGGYTMVQDPESADVGFMPQQAINLNAVDKIASSDELPAIIRSKLK